MDSVGHNTKPVPGHAIIEQLPGQYQKRWAQCEAASSTGSDGDSAILDALEEGTQKSGKDDEAELSKEPVTADDTPPPTEQQEEKEEPQREKLISMPTSGRRGLFGKGFTYKDIAFQQYALAYSLEPDNVTIKMIEENGGMKKMGIHRDRYITTRTPSPESSGGAQKAC